MIEFVQAELRNLEQEREKVSILLHKIEAGITVYRLLLEKFDGRDISETPGPRDESSNVRPGSEL